jgi:hypothetical protein
MSSIQVQDAFTKTEKVLQALKQMLDKPMLWLFIQI